VSLNKQVWHLNYQDAIAIGKLFLDGELYCERVIALGGPQVKAAAGQNDARRQPG
jgi:Na+-transporting NADH:ubiquinone oxidoreductase subunit A